ncbi:acyl-CoA-binding domain-containing protein 4 [Xenopus laevis]|uniref:Acyl-CoA-binding domain-containing protein 5 n=2 Tax=Xenopus laevis TaxID=8355 RepID=A0A1L8ESC2_XENLA|nr:acyl-CoA-binding domain-containing protein 4 [Xenopus laevis]XP_041432270.1 acyl-CoA-binding domain-containing protein 4 [Xenopus laevis]OCT62242.1 hypothetical protein XELAEV_18043326mg [Xenopus laevis]
MGTDQEETGYQIQFNAAVSVIQNLPKNGSYRPSYEEMLRFYSYYKQASVGPCNIARPGFWDPIGRYKWDAWNRLGRMSQQDAMRDYIQEMKLVAQKVIDTVPLEDASPEMFEHFRPLYEVIPDMPRPPESFFSIAPEETPSWEAEERRQQEGSEELSHSLTQNPVSGGTDVSQAGGSQSSSTRRERRGDPVGEDSHPVQDEERRGQILGAETEDSRDGVEQLDSDKDTDDEVTWIYPHLFRPSCDVTGADSNVRRQKEDSPKVANHGSERDAWQMNPTSEYNLDSTRRSQSRWRKSQHQLHPQIMATVQSMQNSIQRFSERLEGLEKALKEQQMVERSRQYKPLKPWFSFSASSRTLFFILVWPIIVNWLLHRYRRKR